jgi:hypothetical protein
MAKAYGRAKPFTSWKLGSKREIRMGKGPIISFKGTYPEDITLGPTSKSLHNLPVEPHWDKTFATWIFEGHFRFKL